MNSVSPGEYVYHYDISTNNGRLVKVLLVDSDEHEAQCQLDDGQLRWFSIDHLQKKSPSEFKL